MTVDDDLTLLVEASRSVPIPSHDYQQHNYITNVLLTGLDLQMHNVAANNSIRHCWEHRSEEVRTHVLVSPVQACAQTRTSAGQP